MMNEEKGSGFLLGLLAGTVLGAAVAVLLTPATGEETRQYLREKAYEPTKAKVMGLAEDVRIKAVDLAEEVKVKATGFAKDLKERAGEAWDKSKNK